MSREHSEVRLFYIDFSSIKYFMKLRRGKCSMTRDFTRHILDCSPNKWVAQASPYGSKLATE